MQSEVIINFVLSQTGEVLDVLPGLTNAYRNISAYEMADICARSARWSIPESRTLFFCNQPEPESILAAAYSYIYSDKIRQNYFEYDLLCFRIDYLKQKQIEGWEGAVIFTDIDVIFHSNVLDKIDFSYDVYIGVNPENNSNLTVDGLPGESLMFNTTNGITICKATDRAIAFFEAIKEKVEQEYANKKFQSYGKFSQQIEADFLKWWCVIHSTSLVIGRAALMGLVPEVSSDRYSVGLLDDNIYNYAPNVEDGPNSMQMNVDPKHFNAVKMFHFRGVRKFLMRAMAQHLRLI